MQSTRDPHPSANRDMSASWHFRFQSAGRHYFNKDSWLRYVATEAHVCTFLANESYVARSRLTISGTVFLLNPSRWLISGTTGLHRA